jgi:predicted transcriptional regulator
MKDRNTLQKISTSTKLEISDSNHIKFTHGKLSFEVSGGINPNNYNSLWVMLVTANNTDNRNKYRCNVDLLNSTDQNNYVLKTAEKTLVHKDKVKEAIDKLIDELLEYKLELQNNHSKQPNNTYQLSDTEREQAIEQLKQPNLLNTINTMIGETGLIGNDANRMILFLTYLSRKRNTNLHAVIQSQYNYLQNKMSQLIPDEEKYELSNVSDSYTFYFTEDELQHKVVLVEDTLSNRKQLRPLLGFQTKNLVTKTTVIKNELAQYQTVQKHVKGNVSLSISTNEEQAFSQNGALSFVIHEETGKIQDEKVLLYQRKQSAGIIRDYNEQKVVKQIQNLQRVLSNISIINPFAMEICLPEQIKNKQITNLHYLRFIEVITLLKQHQRPRKVDLETAEEYIETTPEDIKEANQLLSEIFVNKSDVLNKPTRLHLERLKRHLTERKSENGTFTLHEISIALQVPKTSVKRYNNILIETGFVLETNQGDKKNGYLFELVNADEYTELKTSIGKVMTDNIISIERLLLSEPKTTANQNESGALNVLKNNAIDEVNHKPTGGIEEITIKNTHKKKVA